VGEGATGSVNITTGAGTASIGGFTFSSQEVGPQFALIQFTGMLVGIKAELQWQTRNEQEISSYSIESSGDSMIFSGIGIQIARGDSGINNYSFTDSLLQYRINYYRLKIFDNAGNFTYSNIISVQFPVSAQPIKIYPNPASGYVIVEHPAINTSSQIQVIDMNGRIARTIQVAPNIVQSWVDLAGLPAGLYRIVWTGGGNSYSQTLLID
jgi:hypothetical protein